MERLQLIKAIALLEEEKMLKDQHKKEAAGLHIKTKKTIENLDDAQVHQLLDRKWIRPLHDELNGLPIHQIDGLTRKLEALVEKYQITYADNAREIQQTESKLAGMIEELDANEFDLIGLAELKSLLGGN